MFVKPTRIGVRIWDDYNFNDPKLDSHSSLAKVIGRLTSQLLGVWNDTDTDDSILLQNADFQSYRNEFMPLYNRQNPPPQRKMICQDYSPVSDFATHIIETGAEYPLPSL